MRNKEQLLTAGFSMSNPLTPDLLFCLFVAIMIVDSRYQSFELVITWDGAHNSCPKRDQCFIYA